MRALLATFRFGFAAIVAAAVLLRSLAQPFDHDEHQFVASAALIASDALLPYRDFPYFHLPYQSYLVALPLRFSDYLLATARLVCALAALGIVAVVWRRARVAFADLPDAVSTLLAALFALAMLTNPLFLYTAGRAWNHDVATLLALLAMWRVATLARVADPRYAAAGGGFLIGLATGVRSTSATLIPALALATWLFTDRTSRTFSSRTTLAFAFGVGIALLPAFYLFVVDPAAFLYGNLQYNLELDPLYRAQAGFEIAMTFTQKLAYAAGDVLDHPRVAALVFAYCVSGSLALFENTASAAKPFAVTVALCLPALFLAALLPTPTWYQYYYGMQAFLLVGTLAHITVARSWRNAAALAAAVPMLLGACTGARHLWPFAAAAPFGDLTAVRMHETGVRIAELAGIRPGDRILTLGPVYALEGGASVYPALVTGPFQWRTAGFVDESDRRRFGVLGPADLETLGADPRLRAILTGAETDPEENLEADLLEFVNAHEWTAAELDGIGDADAKLSLWSARPR